MSQRRLRQNDPDKKFKEQCARGDKFYEGLDDNGRQNIALLAPKDSVGAEFGVDTGQLSRRFLDLDHFSSFHSIDKWDDHAHSREQYLAVCHRLLGYDKSKVWRMTAQEFAMICPDNYFGFIYIDCYAHTGQDGGGVLEALWPKLKTGGLFSGDDYDRKSWPKTYGAVNEFAKQVGRTVNVESEFTKNAHIHVDRHPTWYWVK